MTTEMQNRAKRLREWMTLHDVTDRFIADLMNVSPQAVNSMFKRPTMPTDRHVMCVDLGFPVELLPRPADIKPGPRPKVPRLPMTTAVTTMP